LFSFTFIVSLFFVSSFLCARPKCIGDKITPFTKLASCLHYNLYFAWVATWTSFNNGQRLSAPQI